MSDSDSTKKLDIVPVTFDNKQALYKAYMPFIKDGGLFVVTNIDYTFGEQVILLINFFGEAEKIAMRGKVIWKTPPGAEGGRMVGVGIQFDGEGHAELCKKIETYLSGMSRTEDTHTL